jgi:hypothetical protein
MKNSNRGRKNQQQRRSQRQSQQKQNNRQQRRSQRQSQRNQRQSQQRRSQRNQRQSQQRRSQRNQRQSQQRRSQRNKNNAQRGGFNAQHLTPQYLPVKCAGGDGSIAVPDWDSEADEGDPNKCGPLDAITDAEVGADDDAKLSDLGLQEQIEDDAISIEKLKELATSQAKEIENVGVSDEKVAAASNFSRLLGEDKSFHDYLTKFEAGDLSNKEITTFKKLLEADLVKTGDGGSGIAYIDDKERYTEMVDLYESDNLKGIKDALVDPTSLPDVAEVDLDDIVTNAATTAAPTTTAE